MAGERNKYAQHATFVDSLKAGWNATVHPQDESYEKQVDEYRDNAALLKAHEAGENLTHEERQKVQLLRAGNS
jgi:hypothetical protein